jgi:DNA-binding CsgD family transcriptional regulator
VEFIVAATDPVHGEALRAALWASGLESGSEIASATQLQRLLEGRPEPSDGLVQETVLVVADAVTERVQFVAPALGAGLPVLIWPLRGATPPAHERHRSEPGAARLTAREREVLALVAAGVANKGIARSLGVSPNTVKFHLASLFDKLGVATRAEAIAAAARAGEIAL